MAATGRWGQQPLILLAALAILASAEIQEFHVILPATSTSIHYTNLYLRGPGSVDVSQLLLTPISDLHQSYFPVHANDDDDDDDDDDDAEISGDDAYNNGAAEGDDDDDGEVS